MMKSKIKSYLSVLLLIILVVTCAFVFTSCGKKNKVNQIYVDNSHAPRLTYVQGQELDLQKGILTAVVGKKNEETLIPMTDSDVSVTGYNSDTLGSQNLIVSYKGKTTTITVNVIPRIVVEGYESAYFTGDTLNKVKGKLKVAKDDATTFMISFDDPRVSFSTLDSATPGEKSVTVTYTDGTASYNASYNVLIYDAATSKIDIVYPKKTAYGSHETSLDYTGGYIIIKGGADGKLEKNVNIDDSMTSGYTTEGVNATNTSAQRTITISYLGKTFTYNITVSYSSVSKINDQLGILENINLEAENLVLTEAQKTAAWTAVSEYYKLKNDTNDKNKKLLELFTEDEINTIIRVASVAVSELYREELKEYEGTIIINNEALQFTADSYETTVADLARLKNSNEMLNLYAAVLRSILADFPTLTVRGESTVSSEVFVMPKDIETNVIAMLTHLTSLHGEMKDIPNDWTLETLNDFEPQLYRIKVDIQIAGYYRNGQGSIYQLLSKWREKGDFFEIFYSYYLYCNENYGAEEVVNQMLDNIPWPKNIDTWYSYWYSLASMSSNFKADLESGTTPKTYMTDLTPYMYYYKMLTEGAKAIKANATTDKLTYDLYNIIGGDLRLQQIRTSLYGYLDLQGFLADENGFIEMWNTYLALVDLYAKGELIGSDGRVITAGFEDKYEAVMNNLFELSPAELSEFLGSLNFLYLNSTSDILALSVYSREVDGNTVSTYINTLATLINAYYKVTFDADEFKVFEKLLVAMENYARMDRVENAKTAFKNAMAEAITAYTAIDDKTLFNEKMGNGYSLYVKLYEKCCAETNITVEGISLDHINALLSAAGKFETLRDLIVTENKKDESERNIRNEAYIILFALYENVRYSYLSLADMAEEDENLKLAIYNNLYAFDDKELTIEQIFNHVGKYFWNYVLRMPSLTVSGSNGATYSYAFYDIYLDTNFTSFLLYAADMLYAEFNEDSLNGFSENTFKNMVSAYNKIDTIIVGGILGKFNVNDLYVSIVEKYTQSVLASDAETLVLADKLVDVTSAYAALQSGATDENKNAFKSAMEAAQSLKNALTSTENFEKYLKGMYDHYEAILASLNAPQQ